MAWVHKILAWVKKNDVGGMDLIFVMVGVVHKLLAWVNKKKSCGSKFWDGWHGFVDKALLKIS